MTQIPRPTTLIWLLATCLSLGVLGHDGLLIYKARQALEIPLSKEEEQKKLESLSHRFQGTPLQDGSGYFFQSEDSKTLLNAWIVLLKSLHCFELDTLSITPIQKTFKITFKERNTLP